MAPEDISSTTPEYAAYPWMPSIRDTTYSWEVVVSAQWHPEFEAALGTSPEFRAILLTIPGNMPSQPIANPRVLCLSLSPPGPPSQQEQATPLLVREAPVPYGAIAQIQEALRASPQAHQFLMVGEEYLEAFRYMTGASVPEHYLEMVLDRASLLAQLKPGYLIDHPKVLPSMAASFEWFRARYRTRYREHHQLYHQEVAKSRRLLLEAQERVEAVQRE